MDPSDLIDALTRPDGLVMMGADPSHSHSFTYSVAYAREKTEAEVFADALCPEDAESEYMASHTHSGVVDAMKDVQRAMNAVCGVHLSAMGKL